MKSSYLALMLILCAACGEDSGATRKSKGESAIEGAGTESSGVIRSHLYRVAGTSRMSAQDESGAATNLPTGYSDVPVLENSDEGIQGNSVVRATRPLAECGLETTLTTLARRIRDCASKNPNQYEWNGVVKATAGEGTWKLVARGTSTNSEIWLDETTGFLWSPVITTTANWCQAAGNMEGAVSAGGIDCSTIQNGTTLCENASILGIPASQIAWRLPTRNDFLQADLNGARFVLPQTSIAVWTATVNSIDRENAWSIVPQTGILTAQPRSATIGVRCLGRRLK